MSADTPVAVVPRTRPRWKRPSPWVALFVVPGLFLFVLFVLWPVASAVTNSLFRWNGLSPKVFVGFDNFVLVLNDPLTWSALGHSITFALVAAVGKVVLGLLIALLVSRPGRGISFFRSALFVPVLMSFVAVGLLWRFVLDPNLGLLNAALGAVGLPDDTAWLGNPDLALMSVIVVDIWKWLGYHVLLFVAALQSVRPELYENARLDGAGMFQQFRHVTLPSLKTMIGLNFIIAIAGGLNTFDLIYVMTQGGPQQSTELVLTLMYRLAFGLQQYGPASAIAFLLFIFVALLTVVQLRGLRSDYND